MSNIVNLMRRGRRSRHRISSEGQFGRRRRLRQATKKILVPKDPPLPLQPIHPMPVTHHDRATIDLAEAVNSSIAARDIQAAAAIQAGATATQANLAASEDELRLLHHERRIKADAQKQFESRAKKAGLTHELEPRSPWPMRLLKFAATVFEAITLAVPMQLLGVVDVGAEVGNREMIGALLAFVLGITYALLLALLAEGLGKNLKGSQFRHVLETEDIMEGEGWPKPARAVFEEKVIVAAAAALVLALFAASMIREWAISILAAAGESQVSVGWPLFMLITIAVFAAVAAAAYWRATPIADEYTRLNAPVGVLDIKIEAKRRESYGLVGQLEAIRVQIAVIKDCSRLEQLAQLFLAREEIDVRRGANLHIYSPVADPVYVHDFLERPEDHIHQVEVPSTDGLMVRINNIREYVMSEEHERAATENPNPVSGEDQEAWPDDTAQEPREAA